MKQIKDVTYSAQNLYDRHKISISISSTIVQIAVEKNINAK